MAATKSVLDSLHEALAQLLIDEIQFCKDEGIPMSAADKSVIVRFLKDNSITADLSMGAMEGLKEEFQDELTARRKARAEAILANTTAEDDDLVGVL